MPSTSRSASRARRSLTEAERLGRKLFGFDHLHPEQSEVIEWVVGGSDTLAIMPTGAGKSAIYQIAGLMLDGPTVVVSPLLALQRDQVRALEQVAGVEAAAVNSAVGEQTRETALEEFAEDEVQFLFMAPEQFRDEETMNQLRAARPALFVVDEAHCISDWGEDFRPDYLRLGAVVDALGHPTVLALTATASTPVRDEIVSRLRMREPRIMVQGFDRPNISLGVAHFHDERTKREALLEEVERADKPGIVYCATRKHVEDIAEALNERGVTALAYHAGMSAKDRKAIEQRFIDDLADVMVATNAFGMGIDKPNVRFVFHYDIPESVDAYYQEIGRAGRDGDPARALLFYRAADLTLHRFFAGTGQVNREQLQTVVETIEAQSNPALPQEIAEQAELSRAKIGTALNRLEEAGAVEVLPTGAVVETEEPFSDDLVDQALRSEEQRRETEQSRIEMIRGFAETDACRRKYVLNYFGDDCQVPCNNCDNCAAGHSDSADDSDVPFALQSRVHHTALGAGTVQRYEGDTIVVLFDDVGYKSLALEFVQEMGALTEA